MPLPAPFTFSQSSLQDYTDCPRRFQLRYIERLQWPAIESEPVLENENRQQEGQLFHRLIQQHLIGLPADNLARLASTSNLRRWWENYLGYKPDLSGYTQYIELSLSAPIGKHRLLAKYDLVAVQTGNALIVDWKTYAKRPRNEWIAARWQTRVYRALLAMAGAGLNGEQTLGPESIEMIYWFTDYPIDPARFPYSAAQFKRDQAAIETLVAEITSVAEFPKTDEEQKCAFCVFRSYCERGIIAGESEESEQAEMNITMEEIAEIAF